MNSLNLWAADRKRLVIMAEKQEISVERIREIEKLANKIDSEKGFAPIFDLIKFLKEEGFAVAMKPLDDDTTGVLMVDDNTYVPDTQTHRLIVINSLLKESDNFIQRRRFIIAHEYGHFLLHKEDATQYAHRDTSKKETVQEKEADFFARCLLMPQSIVRSILDIDNIKKLKFDEKVLFISRFFNVTTKKARQRLKEDLNING